MKKLAALLFLLVSTDLLARSPNSWLVLDADETSVLHRWKGGSGTLQVWGPFTGGPTVTLEFQSHQNAPFEEPQGPCISTAPAICNFTVGNGDLRIVVTGGSGTDIVAANIGETNQASIGGGAGGSTSFAALTTGTNTTADMVVGTGATLGISGLGTISGTELDFDGDGTPNVFDSSGMNFDADDDGTPEMVIALNDSVGIGTTAAVARLEVDSIANSPTLRLRSDSGANIELFDDGTGANWEFNIGGGGTDLIFSRSTLGEVFRFRGATGFFGVGTATPGGLFDVNSFLVVNSTDVVIGPGLTFAPPPGASPPGVCSGGLSGHQYWDTNQLLLCRCNGVAWEGFNVGGGGAVTCT